MDHFAEFAEAIQITPNVEHILLKVLLADDLGKGHTQKYCE